MPFFVRAVINSRFLDTLLALAAANRFKLWISDCGSFNVVAVVKGDNVPQLVDRVSRLTHLPAVLDRTTTVSTAAQQFLSATVPAEPGWYVEIEEEGTTFYVQRAEDVEVKLRIRSPRCRLGPLEPGHPAAYRSSKNVALGVFATQRIPQGVFVGDMTPPGATLWYMEDEACNYEAGAVRQLDATIAMFGKKVVCSPCKLGVTLTRLNHSDDPNCGMYTYAKRAADGSVHLVVVVAALRLVEKDEELTIHYGDGYDGLTNMRG